MRVLIAFDKFKGALSAPEACARVAEVLRRERPSWQLDLAPLADGGDGFGRILTEAAGGTWQGQLASGALYPRAAANQQLRAGFGWVGLERLPALARERLGVGETRRLAVVEMASVNGLSQIAPSERDVWRSSSRGTGELIQSAARAGADAVLLGVGGSATSDLGLGALSALGLRFETRTGVALDPPLPGDWSQVVRISGQPPPLPPLRIACDVRNPLLGASGAAAVYGPQKGLAPAELPRFEAEAERLARLLCAHAGSSFEAAQRPGAGAAGGIAFGLAVALGAKLVAGFELVAEWLDLAARIQRADWVLTGEGRFDTTSLTGKGPGTLLERAASAGRRCAVFAGAIELEPAQRAALSAQLRAISNPAEPLERALPATAENLARATEEWLAQQGEAAR